MNTEVYNFDDLNEAADITTLKGVPELKRTTPKELHGPCPFGGPADHTGFWININDKPMTWACRHKDECRGRCSGGGDAMQYIATRDHLDRKKDARQIAAVLANEIGASPSGTCSVSHKNDIEARAKDQPRTPEPPPEQWQQVMIPLVDQFADNLYSDTDEARAALYYLHDRGLSDRIIHKYKMGYVPCQGKYFGYYVDDQGNRVYRKPDSGYWIPEGITIPTFINGKLYRVKVRKMEHRAIASAAARDQREPNKVHDPKNERYSYVTGAANGSASLFNADAAAMTKPRADIVFCEGELDAALINSLVFESDYGYMQAVTFGSKSIHPPYETYYRYFRTPKRIAVIYDNDDSGREGAAELIREIKKITTRETPPILATIPKEYKDFGEWYEAKGKGDIIKFLWDLFPLE